MSTTTNVTNLIINKLTKAQYEAIQNPDPTQLYFIIDDNEYAEVSDLPQPSNTTPNIDGVGNAGVSATYARGDHTHPAELPSQIGNGGKYLTTDGNATSWSSLGTVLNYKGTKATIAALPSSGNVTGDVWIVTENNSEHVWNGSTWEEFGPTIDLSGYMEKGIDYVTAGQASGSTLGQYATAEGYGVTASGHYSHAEGNTTIASGYASHAEGDNTTASGYASHAEGGYTAASGEFSHAEGYSTTASEAYSHAEGNWTTASGAYSHAEGRHTNANGKYSHAEGDYTNANGNYSHAEGYYTNANGNYSHAEGCYITASGAYSHAEGWHTTAQRRSQHVFGEYNVLDTTGSTTSEKGSYIEIVGNGTSNSYRSNARTLDWSGNETLAGTLTIGGANGWTLSVDSSGNLTMLPASNS